MTGTTQEVESRWSAGGVVRALVVGSLAWAIGSGLGYVVGHEKVPVDRRADAPAASGPGDVRPAPSN